MEDYHLPVENHTGEDLLDKWLGLQRLGEGLRILPPDFLTRKSRNAPPSRVYHVLKTRRTSREYEIQCEKFECLYISGEEVYKLFPPYAGGHWALALDKNISVLPAITPEEEKMEEEKRLEANLARVTSKRERLRRELDEVQMEYNEALRLLGRPVWGM